jgi:predicted MFS family arabinose efflux permease
MPLPVAAPAGASLPVPFVRAEKSDFRTSKFALPGLFGWFGMVMGSWVGRIPTIRDGAHLSHADLSLVLLMGGVGAVMSFPLSSLLMARHGGRLTMLFAGSALLLVLLAIGLASSVPLLMAAVLMLGITASTFDVGMNAVAAQQEQHDGQSRMALLHAHACAGGLTGVTLGSGMAAMQISLVTHFAILALPALLLLRYATCLLPAGSDARPDSSAKRSISGLMIPRGDLAFLGALGFLGAIAEGSIANWGGIFMKDQFGVSDSFAPLSLSAFSAMMLLSRLWGDRLKVLHGAKPLVAGGALLAAAGLFFAVCAPNAYLALGGFATAGMGLSLVFPFVFSAAGREGSLALAGIATMAYAGSLIGPPLLGAIAHHLGMEAAMSMVGLLALLIAITTTRTRLMT